MSFNKILRATYPYVLAIVLLYFVWRIFSEQGISLSLKYISAEMVLVSFLFYGLLIKPINTLRYSYFFNIKEKIKLYSIMNFSNLMLNILPFRSGELTYIHYLKKLGVAQEKSIPGLLTIRFFDYIALAIFFFISIIFVGTKLIPQENIIILLVLAIPITLILALLLLFTLIKKGSKLHKIFFTGIAEIKSYSKNKLLFLFSLTFIYWFSRLLFGYVLLLILGININFLVVVFISSLIVLIGLIPIQIFANFGVFEFGWIYLLSYLSVGFSESVLFNKILTLHLLPLIPTIILGIIGYSFLRFFNSD